MTLSITTPFLIILKQIQKRGKLIYGSEFRLNRNVIKTMTHLSRYFSNDCTSQDTSKINPNKGILLIGKPESGKTTLMYLMNFLFKTRNTYQLKSCLEIDNYYKKYGLLAIQEKFIESKKRYCLDDFGLEKITENTSIIKLIIEAKLKDSTGIKLHLITSLSLKEIREKYGSSFAKTLEKNFNIIKL